MKLVPAPQVVLLVGLLLLGTENVSAQSRGGLGSQQQNQQDGFGGGSQRQFGTSGRSNRQGQGNQGQQRTSGFGQSRNQGRQGSNSGQQSRGQQDTFIGSDAQQIRNQQNNRNQGRGRGAMFNFAIESLNELRKSRTQQHSSNSQKPQVRVHIRPLFTVSQPSTSELTSQLRTQFDNALPSTVEAPQISIRKGKATIAGSVKNEYDKQLAAKMLSLQPGILQVENRLTIESNLPEPLLFPAQ